jgi:hypothetical protein
MSVARLFRLRFAFGVGLVAALCALLSPAVFADPPEYIWGDPDYTDAQQDFIATASGTTGSRVYKNYRPKNYIPPQGESYPCFRMYEYTTQTAKVTTVKYFDDPQDYKMYEIVHNASGARMLFCPVKLRENVAPNYAVVEYWSQHFDLTAPVDAANGRYDTVVAGYTITAYDLEECGFEP